MKRYIVFVLIFLLNLPFLLTGWLVGNYVNANVIFLLALVYALYLIRKVEVSGQEGVGLTNGEKVQVVVTEIFNPIIAGAFYYYCWKNRFAKKASQANMYSYIVVVLVGAIVFGLSRLGVIKI